MIDLEYYGEYQEYYENNCGPFEYQIVTFGGLMITSEMIQNYHFQLPIFWWEL